LVGLAELPPKNVEPDRGMGTDIGDDGLPGRRRRRHSLAREVRTLDRRKTIT